MSTVVIKIQNGQIQAAHLSEDENPITQVAVYNFDQVPDEHSEDAKTLNTRYQLAKHEARRLKVTEW